MRPHCHCYYIPNLRTEPTVVTRLTNHLKLCLFCSSSLPIYYYCTERIFTQKALFTGKILPSALMGDSFVCACHKIGNQKHSGLPSDQNWNCFTVKIFSSFKKPFHFHTIIISVNFRNVNFAYYFRRS